MRLPTVHRRDPVVLADVHELRTPMLRTSAGRVILAAALAATLAGIVLLARSAKRSKSSWSPLRDFLSL